MNGENWDPPGVPTTEENALITFNGTYDVVLAENQSIRGITLGGTGGVQTLRLQPGAALTLTEDSSVQGFGVLVLDDATVNGPLENYATIRMDGGTLSLLQANRGLVEAVDGRNAIQTNFPNFNGPLGTLRVVSNSSDSVLTLGTTPLDLPLLSSGRIELVSSNGNQATLDYRGGPIENLPAGVISLSGGMNDAGLHASHVENHGLVSGQGSLNGSYRQLATGSLQLDIGGTTAGEEYEVFNVAMTADLDGGLIIDFQDGFLPADTDEFRVIRHTGGSGEFNSVQISGVPGYKFTVDYQADGVVLNFSRAGVLQGDYNGNGLVEQGDLDHVLGNWGWQGRTPLGWTNDFPDTTIDQNELDRVLGNWGTSEPGVGVNAAGVPEPASWALLVVAIAAIRFMPAGMRSLARRPAIGR